MTRILITFLLFFISPLHIFAQPAIAVPSTPIPDASCVSIDAMTAYLRQNFNSDTARIRAIYNWVTTHISYDVQQFLARDKKPVSPSPTPAEVLSSRKGVCQGYSELFIALCKGSGINAVMVGGYSKQFGKVSDIGHSWVAILIDAGWYLFDPTWGAGYVKNDVFMKRYNDKYYKVTPIKFIEDHMPCDPMYQFLSYPLSHEEFKNGQPAAGKQLFNYNDSIRLYNQLTPELKAAAELRRVEAAGTSNRFMQERAGYLKRVLSGAAAKVAAVESKDAFESSSKSYKEAFALYKAFMVHKRNQFNTLPDAELRTSMDSIEFHVKTARSLLLQAQPKTEAQRDAKAGMTGSIDKFWTEVIKQKDFALKYLATDKEKRKLLFMR
jgi:hypothetical protein